MKLTNSSILRTAAVIVCGIGAVKIIQAFNPQPDPPVFSLVGMTLSDEFMRLNVSNLPIPGFTFGGACEAQLSFADEQGRILKSVIVTLALGQSAHVDFGRADLGSSPPPTGDRIELLPSLVRGGLCTLLPSVEVVSTLSGHTDAYVARAGLPDNHNETLVRDPETE